MKYALVTGANRGLGKGFVEYLADNGYVVFAGVRHVDPVLKSNDRITYLELDVASDISIADAVKEIRLVTYRIDLLVNNAGVNKDSVTTNKPEQVCRVANLRRDLLLKMFDVNSVSPLMLVHTCLPLLQQSERSFVINISSCRASFHDEYANDNPNYGYAASKLALNMFTYGLAKELPKNVKTFAVHPGDVQTNMNQEGDQLPYDQAGKIMSIADNWDDTWNGKFMRWSGEEYPL